MRSRYRGQDQEGAAEDERVFSDATDEQADGSTEGDGRADGGETPQEGTSPPTDEDHEEFASEVVPRGEFNMLQERHLRLAAEYDNFRKRTDRERTEQRERAQGQIVQQLLEALDDLERVAGLDSGDTTVDAVLEGVQLVERKFFRALEAAGLERVAAHGERFDPEQHEALMLSTTTEPAEDETVGEVFQSGYRFKGALLRPARVQVRKLED